MYEANEVDTLDKLSKFTILELRKISKQFDISGVSRDSKSVLCTKIVKHVQGTKKNSILEEIKPLEYRNLNTNLNTNENVRENRNYNKNQQLEKGFIEKGFRDNQRNVQSIVKPKFVSENTQIKPNNDIKQKSDNYIHPKRIISSVNSSTSSTEQSAIFQPKISLVSSNQTGSNSSFQPTSKNVEGILEVCDDGFGFLRCDNYLSGTDDIYIAPTQIRRFKLKTGDMIKGIARIKRNNEKFAALLYVNSVNDCPPGNIIVRKSFESLTPIYPDRRIFLETSPTDYSMRLIDLIAPIGKGQRGMIVSPPKAGKTTLLKKIAQSISVNHEEAHLIVLLIDERPEEVTDIQSSIDGEVIFSTFDELPDHHIRVAEMVLNRAQRLVEHGKDVVILMDSLTRLSRAYNLTIPSTGKTLSGGLDPGALHKPKRFFGSARNIKDGGSLTILATALVDTGSRMDDMIFEEFKGTGNMEVHLDRKLQEKRVFPAIDINKSGTRKEELLLNQRELEAIWTIRKALNNQSVQEVTESVINRLVQTKSNAELAERILLTKK